MHFFRSLPLLALLFVALISLVAGREDYSIAAARKRALDALSHDGGVAVIFSRDYEVELGPRTLSSLAKNAGHTLRKTVDHSSKAPYHPGKNKPETPKGETRAHLAGPRWAVSRLLCVRHLTGAVNDAETTTLATGRARSFLSAASRPDHSLKPNTAQRCCPTFTQRFRMEGASTSCLC